MTHSRLQPRAVIFDMDGVLVDSYQAHWESWHFMADELGKGLTEEQFVATFGRTSREIIAAHWGAGALSPQEIAEFDQLIQPPSRSTLFPYTTLSRCGARTPRSRST